jgi:hypothetical protein
MKNLSPVYARIQNFQSIADLEIEINGFTCITGITNIGKSAIIRAISSAFLNNPVVGAVRSGEKFCTVSMESEDWGFKWEKGEPKSGVNRYELKRPTTKELEKIGQGQLDEIASMGFNSVQVGSKVIHPWLASQFEPIFLLNMSGPAVTDFISDISRLGILQDAILLNVRGKKRVLDKAKLKADEVELLKEKEQKLVELDALLTLNDELNAQYESIQEYEERIRTGEELDRSLGEAAKDIRTLQDIRKAKIPDDDIGDDLEQFREMYLHWIDLEIAAKNILTLRDITSIVIPEPSDEVPQIVQAATLADRIDRVEQIISRLSEEIPLPELGEYPSGLLEVKGVLARIETIEGEENTLRGQLDAVEKEMNEVEEELAKIPTCSTCKRPWSEDHSHTTA